MRSRKGPLLLILMIAITGIALVRLNCEQGPGVGGDATIYLTSARGLVEGRGLGVTNPRGEFRLLPYFPPFFPLVLAFSGMLGLNVEAVAFALNLALFGGLIFLAGWFTLRAGAPPVFAALAALLMAVSPVLIPTYSWLMSEPLAIFLGFAGLVMALAAAENPRRIWLAPSAGLILGLSLLTRYTSAAFLAAGFLVYAIFCNLPWRARLKNSGLLLATGILPMLVWIGIDLSQTATVSSRSMESGAVMLDRLAAFFPRLRDVLLFWVVPDSWITSPRYPVVINDALVWVAVLALVAWALLIAYRAWKRQRELLQSPLMRLAAALGLFILAYVALVLFVFMTTYPPITIGTRMFSPVHVAVLWLTLTLAVLSVRAWPERREPGTPYPKKRLVVMAIAAGLVLLTAWYGFRSMRIIQMTFHQGMGFNMSSWQQSDLIRYVRELPDGQLLATNEEMAVLYLTGRTSYPLAEIFFTQPVKQQARYGDTPTPREDLGQHAFREDGALLVLFDSIHAQLESIYGEQAGERVASLTRGLRLVYQGADGAVYSYR